MSVRAEPGQPHEARGQKYWLHKLRLSGIRVAQSGETRDTPATQYCDFSVVPVTSSESSGSMPPSLAIVSLLGALSVASDQIAQALSSLVSLLPSRTSVHSGATAPVRAIAPWFS